MMRRLCCTLMLALCVIPVCVVPAWADEGFVTQLDEHNINITIHFTGEQILFFGAMSSPGDVVIKIVSPHQDAAMSRKNHIGPLWLDGGRMVIKNTPGLYYLASTKPLAQLLDADERARYGLTLESALTAEHTQGAAVDGWQKAFLRLKKSKHYYHELDSGVTLVKDTLFFTRVQMPAKLPEGQYDIEAYLVKKGKVVAKQASTLNVQEVNTERWVTNIAHQHPWYYGAAFTLMCMIIGLTQSMLLRRSKDD